MRQWITCWIIQSPCIQNIINIFMLIFDTPLHIMIPNLLDPPVFDIKYYCIQFISGMIKKWAYSQGFGRLTIFISAPIGFKAGQPILSQDIKCFWFNSSVCRSDKFEGKWTGWSVYCTDASHITDKLINLLSFIIHRKFISLVNRTKCSFPCFRNDFKRIPGNISKKRNIPFFIDPVSYQGLEICKIWLILALSFQCI